ncbi:MAG: hypothetical protein AWM53_00683 [Candidatus Dichloromethanomonas elyunquensis]|nr:MAG: hypothetical protein AWM53_00683 [Candidatus Dichloromethanomonas elyunquensis]
MPRTEWGRPRKNDLWNDIQALALWIFIVGIVGYLLFPDFFHSVYSRLTLPAEQTQNIGEITLPSSNINVSGTVSEPSLPNVYNSLYSGDSEISDGYWAIFVMENEFSQLALSTESYAFVIKLIDGDRKAEVKNTVLLAANGKIQKYAVSDEVYAILLNMSKINTRSGKI